MCRYFTELVLIVSSPTSYLRRLGFYSQLGGLLSWFKYLTFPTFCAWTEWKQALN